MPPPRGVAAERSRLSLDFEAAERAYARDPSNDETPESIYDRKWAGIAIDRALQRLRHDSHQRARPRARRRSCRI